MGSLRIVQMKRATLLSCKCSTLIFVFALYSLSNINLIFMCEILTFHAPSAAREVTIGLASHCPCVTHSVSVYGLNRLRKGNEHPSILLYYKKYGILCLYPTFYLTHPMSQPLKIFVTIGYKKAGVHKLLDSVGSFMTDSVV